MQPFDMIYVQNKQVNVNIDQNSKPQISALKFVFVIYFCVCGGAYGFEDAVQQGFPAYTLCFLFVVPLVWALPIALVTAELGSAMPSNQGAFLWIKKAFGKNVSFITAIMYWFNYTVDTALYPALFYAYFKYIDEPLFSQTIFQITIPIATTFVIVVLNFLGIEIIGVLSVILLIFQLSPVLILFILSVIHGKLDPKDWIKVPKGDQLSLENLQRVALCLQVMIWSYSGYDSVGSMVEELKDSHKNLRKCLFGASALATTTYLFVILGSLGVDKDYAHWKEGSLAAMGETIGGPWFKYCIITAAMVASLGTFNALMCPTSQQLKSLGGPDYLDLPILSYTHPRFKTPWVAIAVNGVICGCAGILPFLVLIQINNILYGVLIIFICLSAVKLRYDKKGKKLYRPIKVAEDDFMVVLVVVWPILICLYLIGSALAAQDEGTYIVRWTAAGVVVALGLAFLGCKVIRKSISGEGGREEEEEEVEEEEEEEVQLFNKTDDEEKL